MSVIQKYKASGTLVRWHDFRSGTIDDLSGNVTATFFNTPDLNKEGLQPMALSDNGVDSGTLDIGTNDFSVACLFRGTDDDDFYRLLGGQTASAAGLAPLYIQQTTGRPRVSIAGDAFSPASGDSIMDNRLHVLGVSCDRSGNVVFYLDGVEYGTVDISSKVSDSASTTELTVGADQNNANKGFAGGIGAALIFNNQLLTAEEHSRIASELLAQKKSTKPRSKTQATSLIDKTGNAPDLLWNLKPMGNTVVEQMANNNGVINGKLIHSKCIVGDCQQFGGDIGDYISVTSSSENNITTGDFTLGAMVKLPNTISDIQFIFDKRAGAFSGGNAGYGVGINNSGQVIGGIGDGPNRISDGTIMFDTDLSDNQWHLVLWEFDRDGNATGYVDNQTGSSTDISSITGSLTNAQNLRIGKKSYSDDNPYEGALVEPFIFKKILTADEKTQLYNNFSKLVEYKTDWGTPVSISNVTSGQLEDTDFWNTTGTHKIETDTHNGQKVKVINPIVGGTLTLMTESFNDDNWKMYVDTGSGYELVESGMMASNVLTTTTGEKIILADINGNYSITKYLGTI